MSSKQLQNQCARISIGIFAWNEEAGICRTLESLLQQTVFQSEDQALEIELLVLVNGTTDQTAAVAQEFLKSHAGKRIHWQVCEIRERGKLNAWNRYVHEFSSPGSQFLFMMDADIHIHELRTLEGMLRALEVDPSANVATSLPRKDIDFKPAKTAAERLSVTQARMTVSQPAQLCGQLYCIRSEVARKLWMPRDLPACEDGFIKWLVCTDLLTANLQEQRVVCASGAEHTFEAYISPGALLRNQKRQVIGQTVVHLLIDCFLPSLTLPERLDLGKTLKDLDQSDPGWLKRLVANHLKGHRFWQLYPGIATLPFKRWWAQPRAEKIAQFVPTFAGALLTCAGAWAARRAMRRGAMNYWPRRSSNDLPESTGGLGGWSSAAGSPKPL